MVIVAAPALESSAGSQREVEIAPLHTRVKVSEARQRARVARRQPQISPGLATGAHSPLPDATAQKRDAIVAAAARGVELEVADRLLVRTDGGRDLQVDVEVGAAGLRGRPGLGQRLDEWSRVEGRAAHRRLDDVRAIDDVGLEIVSRRDARLGKSRPPEWSRRRRRPRSP